MAADEQYEAAKGRVEARIGFATHLAVYLVINIIFLIVVGWDFLWATVFWGLGLACHGFGVFFRNDPRLRGWKERAIAKEMERDRGGPPPTGGTIGEPPTAGGPPTAG